MNKQEILNTLKIIGATFFGALAMRGYMTKEQATAIMSDLATIVPAALSAGTIVLSIYSHWNMKKVPENSVAIATAGPKDAKELQGQKITGTVIGALLIATMTLFVQGDAKAQTASAVLTAAETQVYAALNTIIGFASGFVQADLNAAIADAQTQSPPNTQAIVCWQTIAKIPVATIPTGAGLAYLKQRFLDLQGLYMPLNSNCGSVAPLFLKQYNQFMSLAAAQNL